MVTSTYVLPEFPAGHEPDGVTLFDIGGTKKTFEAHDYGYLTAEPSAAKISLLDTVWRWLRL